MATYIVGDLHGCFDELQAVLKKAEFNPKKDELWLTGDIIARGEQSLECLRFVKSLGKKATMVLGNHDLHLLATSSGIKKVNSRDKLEQLFDAKDFDELMEWLRQQPLLAQHPKYDFLLAHAGISPDWSLSTAKKCAKEVEKILQSKDYKKLLEKMYEANPEKWDDDLKGIKRHRYTINSLTRMRYCDKKHRLDFACKLPVEKAPKELKPWFECDNPLYRQYDIIFGHWASLIGYQTPKQIHALDTGCVWGNHLTLIRWEDKKVFIQKRLS